jgi:hypothetical protein
VCADGVGASSVARTRPRRESPRGPSAYGTRLPPRVAPVRSPRRGDDPLIFRGKPSATPSAVGCCGRAREPVRSSRSVGGGSFGRNLADGRLEGIELECTRVDRTRCYAPLGFPVRGTHLERRFRDRHPVIRRVAARSAHDQRRRTARRPEALAGLGKRTGATARPYRIEPRAARHMVAWTPHHQEARADSDRGCDPYAKTPREGEGPRRQEDLSPARGGCRGFDHDSR